MFGAWTPRLVQRLLTNSLQAEAKAKRPHRLNRNKRRRLEFAAEDARLLKMAQRAGEDDKDAKSASLVALCGELCVPLTCVWQLCRGDGCCAARSEGTGCTAHEGEGSKVSSASGTDGYDVVLCAVFNSLSLTEAALGSQP